MNSRSLHILITLLFICGTRSFAQIPAIADVPTCASAADRAALEATRASLQQQRANLKSRAAQQNSSCANIPASSSENAPCQASQSQLQAEIGNYASAVKAFNARAIEANKNCHLGAERVYHPSGNALIGGTTWITGYNAQSADPALIAKEHQMMKKQMELAGLQYAEGVDFKRYNFVLGIAASTTPFIDLAKRVIFDEFTNGKFSATEQAAYDSLKDRQFGELACHSNGAMVCLAALENKDVTADHVTLYGPQVTLESLQMWNDLVSSGRVKSVQIYINQSDPVPPVSMLTGGGLVAAADLSTLATFKSPTLVDIINQTGPKLTVQTFSCGTGTPTLDCHAMTAYKARVSKSTSSGQTVPGTKVNGVGVQEPPAP